MKPRGLPLALGLVLSALAVAAEETPAAAPSSTDLAHEAVKDIKYQPAPKIIDPPLLLEEKSAEAPVMLSPYLVRELPHRTFNELNAALRQKQKLESHALYKRDGFEMILPPALNMYTPPGHAHPDPIPRLEMIFLRLRW
jgi:hypothetical protein